MSRPFSTLTTVIALVQLGTASLQARELTIEQRILITADTGDFRRLLIRIADAGEQHFGVMLVPSSMRTNAFGVILRAIRHELDGTQHGDWIDRCIWLQRPPD